MGLFNPFDFSGISGSFSVYMQARSSTACNFSGQDRLPVPGAEARYQLCVIQPPNAKLDISSICMQLSPSGSTLTWVNHTVSQKLKKEQNIKLKMRNSYFVLSRFSSFWYALQFADDLNQLLLWMVSPLCYCRLYELSWCRNGQI